jgi:hypothetical protein
MSAMSVTATNRPAAVSLPANMLRAVLAAQWCGAGEQLK